MFSALAGFLVQIVGPGEPRDLAQACVLTGLCRCRYIYHFRHSIHVVSIVTLIGESHSARYCVYRAVHVCDQDSPIDSFAACSPEERI
jgi:hypothetical protein